MLTNTFDKEVLCTYVYTYIDINLIVIFIIVMYVVYIHTFGNDNRLAWNIDPYTVAKCIGSWGGMRQDCLVFTTPLFFSVG